MTTTYRYDPSRDRLNRIQTWKIFGNLSFIRPISEPKRVEIFLTTIRQLERRLKVSIGELRWVLAEQGNFTDKLFHFHFLLDGSNLPNKDATKLAATFGTLWEKCGGGNHVVSPYVIELNRQGYQRAVNYVTKVEGFRVPFSPFFNAGENCHLKFSDAMDRHIAAVCNADTTQNQKDNQMNENIDKVRAARIDALANEIIADATADEAERRRHNAEEMKRLERRLVSKSKERTP